jgi:hypothetical protein
MLLILDDVSLFADSSLLVFSEIEYVSILIDVISMNMNEYCSFSKKKKIGLFKKHNNFFTK